MTTQTEITLKIAARHQAKEFVIHARVLASDLEHAAAEVGEWLAEGDLATSPGINSLGEVQAAGPMMDVRAARLCAIVYVLEQMKADDQSLPR